MPFQYKKIVVFGATSGIGEALSERFVDEGSQVVAIGRRQENLNALVARKGAGSVEGVQFDITKLDQIPALAEKLTKAHPDIDCIILNSGIQRKCDFSDPGSIDIDLINLEYVTNYLSYLALTKAFLPFFMAKPTETSLIYISSGLALIPLPRVANYCATKAALHHWILCLREQLRDSKVKVIEVFPPAVQTELHDEKYQPDLKNGRSMGMPLAEFTDEAYEGLAQGLEQVPVQFVKIAFDAFENKRQDMIGQMMKSMNAHK